MMDFIVFNREEQSDHRRQHTLKQILIIDRMVSCLFFLFYNLVKLSQACGSLAVLAACCHEYHVELIVIHRVWGKATVALTRYEEAALKAYSS